MLAGHRLRPTVRRVARVPAACAGGVYVDVEAQAGRLGPHGGLGEGRATDVPEADEEDGGRHGVSRLYVSNRTSLVFHSAAIDIPAKSSWFKSGSKRCFAR